MPRRFYGKELDALIRNKTTPVSLLQHAIATCQRTIHYFGTTAIWQTKCHAINACQREGLPCLYVAGRTQTQLFLDSLPLLAILTAFVGFQNPFPHLQLPFRYPSHAALHGQTTTIDARTNQCHTTIIAKPSLVSACTSVCLVSTARAQQFDVLMNG